MSTTKKSKSLPLEEPRAINRISKAYMQEYISKVGTDEDKKWFVKTVQENMAEKTVKVGKQERKVSEVDSEKLRKAFCERFPKLIKEPSATTYADKILTEFADFIEK